jgi:endo-1,4-beta-D-glucanase Y
LPGITFEENKRTEKQEKRPARKERTRKKNKTPLLLISASMSALPSDEVAEDYKASLEDLTSNDRFQISNLTVIAKENTEHAMAISRVLENHIRTVGAL